MPPQSEQTMIILVLGNLHKYMYMQLSAESMLGWWLGLEGLLSPPHVAHVQYMYRHRDEVYFSVWLNLHVLQSTCVW